jgi:hypothetical protein
MTQHAQTPSRPMCIAAQINTTTNMWTVRHKRQTSVDQAKGSQRPGLLG